MRPVLSILSVLASCVGAALADEPVAQLVDDAALPPIESAAAFAEIMDYDTGTVLFAKRSDELMKPASMAKLMTVALIFQKLKAGELNLDDKFTVSAKVWNLFARDAQTSKMFVAAGESIRLEDLIRGILVVSGNDACAVVAENIAGSEEAFAKLMNQEARRIGLTQSTFANSNGMPDPAQNVTAHELALLARHLIKEYPEYYRYFAERELTWNKVTQPNRDLLLATYPGADGLKTGHTDESGYGITASAQQDGRRMIVVVNGLSSVEARAEEAKRLLDIGFREFKTYALLKPGDTVGHAQIWAGEHRTVPLIVRQPISLLMRTAARDRLRVTLAFNEPVLPPISRGDEMGQLTVTAPGVAPVRIPVYAGAQVREGTLLTRLKAGIKLLLAETDEPALTLRLRPQPSAQ
jgi:serine-type D-Ala-D-Ala carboxypeptidase (penicillin-binding protein 5/6)